MFIFHVEGHSSILSEDRLALKKSTLTDRQVVSLPVECAADNEILGGNAEVAGGPSNSNEKRGDKKIKGLEKKETKGDKGKKELKMEAVGETSQVGDISRGSNEQTGLLSEERENTVLR